MEIPGRLIAFCKCSSKVSSARVLNKTLCFPVLLIFPIFFFFKKRKPYLLYYPLAFFFFSPVKCFSLKIHLCLSALSYCSYLLLSPLCKTLQSPPWTLPLALTGLSGPVVSSLLFICSLSECQKDRVASAQRPSGTCHYKVKFKVVT